MRAIFIYSHLSTVLIRVAEKIGVAAAVIVSK